MPNRGMEDAPSVEVVDGDAPVIARSCEDPTVFGLIFDRHHDAIYRYVARRAGRDVAADVAAETFTTAFSRRRDYDLTFANALPWLYGIAHNLLRSHKRAEDRMLTAYARQGADPVVDAGAEDAYGRAERRLDSAAAVPPSPPPWRP
jgi:DNA-directed RNA polymerase specialized sigma24 family protein